MPGSFNNWNIVQFTNKTTLSEDFDKENNTSSRFQGSSLPYFWTGRRGFFIRLLNNCLTETVQISSTYVYVFKYTIGCFVCVLNSYKGIYLLTPLNII